MLVCKVKLLLRLAYVYTLRLLAVNVLTTLQKILKNFTMLWKNVMKKGQ